MSQESSILAAHASYRGRPWLVYQGLTTRAGNSISTRGSTGQFLLGKTVQDHEDPVLVKRMEVVLRGFPQRNYDLDEEL